MPVKIKICGIRSITDMQCAVRHGADAIGLVFVPSSPRCVSIQEAHEIIKACPPFLTKVGLFVNASSDLIQESLNILNLDLLQFHGDLYLEPNDFCKKFNKPFIKALKISSHVQDLENLKSDILKSMSHYPDAAGFLLDHFDPSVPDQHGGTGKKINWEFFKQINSNKPLILAGGLNPENIQEAINMTQPYAVDVSSGVESSPGVKSPEKIKIFCEQVKQRAQQRAQQGCFKHGH